MFHSSSPQRVIDGLRTLIRASAAGAQLPSTRTLAATHGVGPVTVQRAIRELVGEGLVETRPGSGNFVARKRDPQISDFSWQTTSLGPSRSDANPIGSSMLTVTPDTIPLHSGYPSDELLPLRQVRAALSRAARSPHAARRAHASGLGELREWFAHELTRAGATTVRDSDVLITPGAQSALSSTFRALAGPGDAIVMESPTYWGAIAAAKQAGLIVVPVPRATGAPDSGDLATAFETSGARVFYAQPHFANPTGAYWSNAEKESILKVVRDHGVFLIEDDWARDFGIDADVTPLASNDPDGHVIYVRSLTKSASPALRVAAVVARGPARRRIETDRTIDDLYVSGILQAAAADVLTQPSWISHRRTVRELLRERRDRLISELDTHAPELTLTHKPAGGLNLWLRMPDGSDSEAFAARCLAHGLSISPGAEWFPAEPTAAYIRLNFGGSHPDRFEEAARILAQQLKA
ncbi:PLP-dependent aminotransferase family protein [Rhodococcus sp. IEGM 1379]|uniref:aminotransferase-like domain-containing protein n=1 Tax=Rhodococcus sp. IEGM 1379 TaxID=3047086 RepID=UPI0024B66A1B|nr:PLP-dependent aminotransferase family protein [Rhodococcus sp. IEGM 1379]MDI9914628.1 PLP-dependent aminotransferase family protein [Rhodococcus sp. IEGM 1379]